MDDGRHYRIACRWRNLYWLSPASELDDVIVLHMLSIIWPVLTAELAAIMHAETHYQTAHPFAIRPNPYRVAIENSHHGSRFLTYEFKHRLVFVRYADDKDPLDIPAKNWLTLTYNRKEQLFSLACNHARVYNADQKPSPSEESPADKFRDIRQNQRLN